MKKDLPLLSRNSFNLFKVFLCLGICVFNGFAFAVTCTPVNQFPKKQGSFRLSCAYTAPEDTASCSADISAGAQSALQLVDPTVSTTDVRGSCTTPAGAQCNGSSTITYTCAIGNASNAALKGANGTIYPNTFTIYDNLFYQVRAFAADKNVRVRPTAGLIPLGQTATFSLTVARGYVAKINSDTCGGTLSGNIYTTAIITAACSVTFGTSARPDPTKDASVRGMMNAQIFSTVELLKTQLNLTWDHMQQRHADFNSPNSLQDKPHTSIFEHPESLIYGLANGHVQFNEQLISNHFSSLWIAGAYENAHLNVDGTANKNKFDIYSMTLGTDFKPYQHIAMGASFGYGENDASIDILGSHNRAQHYTGIVYATIYGTKSMALDAILGYGGIDNNGARWSILDNVLIGGHRNADAVYGTLSLNDRLSFNHITLIPFVRGDFMSVVFKEYSEVGDILALSYGRMNFHTQLLSTGLSFEKNYYLPSGAKLTPLGKLQYLYFANSDINQNLFYSNLGFNSTNYMLNMGVLPSNSGSLELGFDYLALKNLNMGLKWIGAVGNDSYTSNQINLRVAKAF